MGYFLYFIILFGIWMLITFDPALPNLIVGGIASLFTTIIFGRYFFKEVGRVFNPIRYFWLVIYTVHFVWECIKGNLDVAYRVLHRRMPLKPGIVKVKTCLKTDIGKTLLANSITMTPGKITVDIVDSYVYVHWVYVCSRDTAVYTAKIVGRFEKYIKRILE